MNDQELEQAFEKSRLEWNKYNISLQINKELWLLRLVRYFYWAGAEMGMTTTNAIHKRHFGEPTRMEIVDDQTS